MRNFLSKSKQKLLDIFLGSAGQTGRDNASNRDEWVCAQLAAIPGGKRLLDAGAGHCRYKPYCGHLDYVSQDFNQYDGKGDGKGLQSGSWDGSMIDIVSDITSIPEPDASFDVILCTEVLEHIIRPEEAIREFSRLLKPGGRLILTAPFCSLTHFAPYHFSTGFNVYWYEKILAEHDFVPLSMTRNGDYFGYIAQEIMRVNYVGERYAGVSCGMLGKIAVQILLRKLHAMEAKDKDSGEVLCFGYHVLAEKKAG